MRRTLVCVILLLAGTASVGGCGTTASPATASVDAAHNAADVAFVEALIASHRTGITLAAAAARQPRARTLAEAIIATQRDEILRMTGWLRTWGVTAPSSSSPAEVARGNPLRALIVHQQDAVALAQREQAQGSNRTALDFAKQVIESRTAETDQLRGYAG
jgi:uncharacterized protein (DUF305 family)